LGTDVRSLQGDGLAPLTASVRLLENILNMSFYSEPAGPAPRIAFDRAIISFEAGRSTSRTGPQVTYVFFVDAAWRLFGRYFQGA
jgi:hypothetical protein